MKRNVVAVLIVMMFAGLAVFATTALSQQGPGPSDLALGRPGPDFEGPGDMIMARMEGRMRGPGPDGPPMMMGRGRGHMMGFAKKLGLTDEQSAQMRKLKADFLNKTRKARAELLTLKDEKRAMVLSGKIDQNRLAAIDDQIVKSKAEVMKAKLKLRRERLSVLNEEQIGKLGDFFSRGGMGHRFGRGRCMR